MHTPCFHDPRLVARRWFLQQCGVGLGAIGLSELLGRDVPIVEQQVADKSGIVGAAGLVMAPRP